VLRELARDAYDVTHLRVDTAQAFEQALRTQEWDLVLSDFSLPTLTAMDVLRVLGASGLDLPCIVVSGTIGEEAAVHALKGGASDFIVKNRLARLLPAVSRELREAGERRNRRAAEAAFNEAMARMRFALEAAGVGTWEVDIASGKSEWSDVMEQLLGQPGRGFHGTLDAFITTIHPDDRQRVFDGIVSNQGHNDSRLEYRVIWPDGSIRWIEGVGQTFYDDTGRPVRAAGVAMDMTVQKQLEQQFHQAQKMESVGQLAGGIAHDFNNLLTAILGYSNFLLEESNASLIPDRMKRDLEEIRRAGESAAKLTSQLLAFSRRQIIQPTVLNMNAVVEGLEPMMRRLIGEDVRMTARLSPDLGSTRADIGQLEQVIMNLAVNARDAMPQGGQITIETANVDLDDAYARLHGAVVPGAYVMLAVSDTGAGMTPEVQAKIFEPFFTTKPKGQGTGLGLATIYGIIRQNNGNIWVYSEPGTGTTFKVYLPRVNEQPQAVAQTTRPAVRGGNETVLLVEDNDLVRRLASTVLTRTGYHVIEAPDADEALRAASEHQGQIHLLLTDVVMPGISGGLLAQRLSERYSDMRVLYMSGYTDSAVVDHGVLSPEVAFLQKPFTPATLAGAVRDVLDT
jgi:two-component system cell cycle sensor histidine kinase/response regulator CckA